MTGGAGVRMTIDHPAGSTVARADVDRSYLLRVVSTRDGARYVVQDLKTGERRVFHSEAELQRFIAATRAAGLR